MERLLGSSALFTVTYWIMLTILVFSGTKKVYEVTSTDQYCMSCHVHTSADMTWKWSTHSNNRAGMDVHCLNCHLPPRDHIIKYTVLKAKHGFKDLYGYIFKDSADIDWVIKKTPEAAAKFTYKASCQKCHTNFFPFTLSALGSDAHLRYKMDSDNKRCITNT